MKRRGRIGLCVLLLGCLAFPAVPGCARKEEEEVKYTDIYKAPRRRDRSGGGEKARTPLKAADLTGTIKGRIVFQGTPPEPDVISAILSHNDKDACLACLMAMDPARAMDAKEQTWMVAKDGGVKNVVLFLEAPDGTFFPVRKEDRQRTDEVIIDQPFCTFVNHVVALYPYYMDDDGKTLKESGQKFTIANSGKLNHNANLKTNPSYNAPYNLTIPPGSKETLLLNPQPTEIAVSCNFHPWMRSYIWTFDHPYAVVSEKDGTFEIRNVPTGVNLKLVAWHENPGYFLDGRAGRKVNLKSGETLDLKDLPVQPK